MTGLASLAGDAAAAVDPERLLDLLSDLVAMRSVGGDETVVQQRMAAELESAGMDVDRWDIDLPAIREHPDYSAEIERDTGMGVVGTYGSGAGPRLMLNGHVDVVPVGDETQWSTPPWKTTVVDDLVYGRGTCDMKGGLACAVEAVRAIADAGIRLGGTVAITPVIGEEDGGVGTVATLERGHSADAAIVLEPTASTVAVSQAGALGFRLTVPGQPAHGALRGEGVSAIEKFELVHAALRSLERERNLAFTDQGFADYEIPLALSIGTVRGGEWASTVPDRLVAAGRYGVAPGEDVVSARRRFEDAVERAATDDLWLADHPPLIEWWGGQFAPAQTDPASHIVGVLAAAHADVTGAMPPCVGVPYGSDMRHLVNLGGIPTVLYGPGDVRRAHTADEFVPVADLIRVAGVIARTVVDFCGVQ